MPSLTPTQRNNFKKMKFIIVAPPYHAKSAGIVVMHKLCDSLNRLGHTATIVLAINSNGFTSPNEERFFGPGLLRHEIDTDNEFNTFVEDGIVIYPEIITGNPIGGSRVVRYLLNKEGAIGGNSMEASDKDFILSFSKSFHDKADAYLIKLTAHPIFSNKNTKPAAERTLDLTYIGKGQNYDVCFIVRDTVEITRQWPQSREDLAILFKQTRFFYTWDAISQTNLDALFCGAIPIFLTARPYESFESLDENDIGYIPKAFMMEKDGKLSIEIPDDFYQKMDEFKTSHQNLIDNYDERLINVIDKVINHFNL